ncbi:hypothetical protein L4X63_02490 [Geomonas sp. Red32]|uniref:hypothetical protein n=1 Tax=Geomonas sp. Red32 TaxID=2912856 RepID=UPI00202CB36A|nr:hypothetical protein [Geomonas sp. Red32]MCM0080449.1 hypothetical protein [Geomonas sp. Red32]
MRWNGLVLASVLGLLLAACMPRQTIKYPLDDVTALQGSPFEKAILVVRPFQDHRKPLTNTCSEGTVAQITKDDKAFFYNCDNNYDSGVTTEISSMMAAHLRQSGLFKEVLVVDTVPAGADYLMTGNVSKFDGLKEQSTAAAVASQFGLLGALVNVANKNAYEGTTAFEEVKLIRLKDNTVVWSGDVIGHIEGTDIADAYGWSCYSKANLSLKEANGNLVSSLAKAGSEH